MGKTPHELALLSTDYVFLFFLFRRKSQSVQEFRQPPHQHSQCFDYDMGYFT